MAFVVSDAAKHPPMLAQYLEYKARHTDCLLLFQVGDFYEVFFDDAQTVAKALNLTLTSRDKSSPDPVPMCGVPVAVVDGYLSRLVDQGFSVAVVSQCEEAQPGKGMVKRRLERIVTPGVRLLGGAESSGAANIVAAIYAERESDAAVAFSDVQSGKVLVRDSIALGSLRQELARIAPAEVILPGMSDGRSIDRRLKWVRDIEGQLCGGALKFRGESYILPGAARDQAFSALSGYAPLSPQAKKAVRLLLNYIDEATLGLGAKIVEVCANAFAGVMVIDGTTRANLELLRNARDGSSRGTLFEFLNETCSAAGERLLRSWIVNPLLSVSAIRERHQAVREFKARCAEREELRRALRCTTDLERIAARLELHVATPRELGALRDSLLQLPGIQEIILQGICRDAAEPPLLAVLAKNLEAPPALAQLLSGTLADSPAPTSNDGGIIRDGFSAELDELRKLKSHGTSWIAEIEGRERERSGINSLKIRYNNVIGYFIEVTKSNLQKVPQDYIRRQSMVGGERFTTVELREREQQVLGAQAKQIALEKRLFEELKEQCLPYAADVRRVAEDLAQLDVLRCLAQVAEREDLCEPCIYEGTDLLIEHGKHAVLAKLLRGRFIANSLSLREGGKNLAVVSGPNMGGKSTFLRQNAIIAILAQMGSFVPASKAGVGIVDKIFARLGAADDLQEGESTFMLEMREMAHIISNATSRSLLLIDEVGRGTASADGLSIARAILEWIALKIKCRTLFATHFHELTELESAFPALLNLSVGSLDDGDTVIFTHEIKPGPANKSYGLEVAKLAGLPPELLSRAREVFNGIESAVPERQLNIFSQAPVRPVETAPKDYARLRTLRDRVESIEINSITPLEALSILSELKTG